MLVAIAGASGKVGVRLIALLKRRHVPVVALVRSRAAAAKLPPGTAHRLVHLQTGFGLPEALRGATHIVNLTGLVDASKSERELYEANVVPTSHLLTAAPKNLKRFVHVSSIAVYGKHLQNPANESSPRHPDGAYARTKLEGERQALRHAGRFSVVVVQPGIIYGPGFEAGFYPLLRQLQKGQAAILGPGDNRVPLIHVDDVVAGLFAALSAPVPSGSVFLLCPTDAPTQAQALQMAARELGVRPPTRHLPPALASLLSSIQTFVRRLQGKPAAFTPEMVAQMSADRHFDPSAARQQLHWRPAINFKSGVRQVVEQYRRQASKTASRP